MKRIVSVALVLLLLAAIVPASSMAAGAVSNGTRKVYHVHTYGGTLNLRRGPGKGYGQITSIVNGTPVNTISDPVWDDVSGRHFIEIEFYDRNGIFRTGWIATSLIGMKR